MKKVIIIILAVLAVALVVSGFAFLSRFADKVYNPDAPSMPTAEKPSANELLTETDSVNKTEVIIENEKYKFTVIKTDFEKNFTEEELWEISSVLSMSFGCEDYYNWNGEAEFVVNELINSCLSTPSKWPFNTIITEDEEILKKASAELSVYMNDESAEVGYGIAELDTLNAYIKDMYGENARTFVGDDFMSVEEALKKNGNVFDYHSDSYSQIRYFPQNDLVWIASRDTGSYATTSYIYDIKTVDGDYVLYTVGDVEEYGYGDDFLSYQEGMFEYLRWGSSEWLPSYVYILGVSQNGDFYLKSVEEKCLYADGFSGDYIVTADIDLWDKRIYTQPFEKVGTVKEGTVVTIGEKYFGDGYEYIINEEFSGYIDPKFLEKIE